MLRLSDSHIVSCINGKLRIIGQIFIDDVSELPSPTGIDGYELVQSSVAYVINSGELYIMDSEGKWYDTNGKQAQKEDLDELT
ncbi:MAG: hypothetical protein K2J32_15020 [Ruminococcus sp.]|nr:hypothetical protein [Ruminococcus sp.]